MVVFMLVIGTMWGAVWRRLTLAGAVSGLVVGVGAVCGLVFTGHDPVWGMNAGIVALAGNLVVGLCVSHYGPRDSDSRPYAQVLAPGLALASDPAG